MSNQKHPKGLYLLYFTGTWERFSYYGMRAILVLYLIQALQFSKEAASELYGSFTGLVYLTPLLGGYIADKFWGNRRSVFWGGVMMAIGEFLLFFSAFYFKNHTLSIPLLYSGLFVLIMGNGFFKPCVTTMVGDLYPPNDSRSSSAFTIFYQGINVGAMLAPLICGTLGDTGDPSDFKWGFLAAGIGMIISLILFESLKHKYLVGPTGLPIGLAPERIVEKEEHTKHSAPKTSKSNKELAIWGTISLALVAVFHALFNYSTLQTMGIAEGLKDVFYYLGDYDVVASIIFGLCIAIPVFIYSDRSLTKIERDRIMVIYVIAFFVIFFWAAFEQAGASLTFFANEQTDRQLLGWEMPASYFQSFNAAFIVLLAPIFAMLWTTLGRKKMDPNSPMKQSIGLFLLAIGYLVIALGVRDLNPSVKVSILWLTSLYFIHTIGELFLSPIGMSMVNKLSPARFASLMMGVWFMSTATANKFAGMLSGLYPEGGVAKSFVGISIVNLYDFFMVFVVMAGIASIILLLLNKWLLKKMHGIQ